VAVVEKVLPATSAAVYDQWLSVDALTEWMCPYPARLRRVELDPVVGGRYRFEIMEGGGDMLVVGRFLALERPHTIRFTWSCSTWPDPLQESIVSVELRPAGSGKDTHMTIRHELVPPDTIASHQAGWRLVADQLADRLSRQRPGL
jgi:uncharacterized protein YndB with AHSA1/START domain